MDWLKTQLSLIDAATLSNNKLNRLSRNVIKWISLSISLIALSSTRDWLKRTASNMTYILSGSSELVLASKGNVRLDK